MRHVLHCSALALLLACTSSDKDEPVDTGPWDEDGDGLYGPEDCDDNNANVGGKSTFYADEDEDSYGDPDNTILSCNQPAGYTTNAEDCSDDSVYQSPIAVEKCDELDNDCDGTVDEDDARDAVTWYPDADEDGYGDANTSVLACEAPEGYLDDASDCDDSNADIKPGQCELCFDGADNDCDGVEVCETMDGADVLMYGDAADDMMGFAAKGVGDVNGDGYADLLFGAPGEDAEGDGAGAAYLVLGGGLFGEAVPDARIGGPSAGAGAGATLNRLGDVDGDGYDDVVVGARGDDSVGLNGGSFAVWQGPFEGDQPWATADSVVLADAAGDGLGGSIAFAGDTDGDGLNDILVSAINADTGAVDGGAAYLFLAMPATGASASDADAILSSEGAGQALGEQVTGIGDLNGDGFGDLGVGIDGEQSTSRQTGAAYMWFGPTDTGSLTTDDLDVYWFGDDTGSMAAYPYGVGDINEDGLDDVAVLARGDSTTGTEGSGLIYLWYGNPYYSTFDDVSNGDATIAALGPDQDLTMAEGGQPAGDLDGDGTDDLIVGLAGDDQAGTDAGAVYALLGPFDGVYDLCFADIQHFGEAEGDVLGFSASGAGDVNGDGRADMVMGAPGNSTGASSAGAAYLVFSDEGW